VVMGMREEGHLEGHDIYLLAEYESPDTREIVRQCGVLNDRFRTELWIGDSKNDAADRFIRQLNDDRKLPAHLEAYHRRFYVSYTSIVEMERLYPYILPELKRLLDAKRRQLFLRNSKLLNYLRDIELNDITELELGDYPAIEAVAFGVIEMRDRSRYEFDVPRRMKRDYDVMRYGLEKSAWNVMDFGRPRRR